MFYAYNSRTSIIILLAKKLLASVIKIFTRLFTSNFFIRNTRLKIFKKINEKVSDIRGKI